MIYISAVGEMGICSSHGIIYALRQCIVESRKHSGYDTTNWLDIGLFLIFFLIIILINNFLHAEVAQRIEHLNRNCSLRILCQAIIMNLTNLNQNGQKNFLKICAFL